jgi:hypothetical protein
MGTGALVERVAYNLDVAEDEAADAHRQRKRISIYSTKFTPSFGTVILRRMVGHGRFGDVRR